MNPNGEIIRVEGVSVSLGGHRVLDQVDLSIQKGEVFVLLGPSGCGKTTLFKCMIGLLVPNEGRVLVGGEDIVPLGEDELDLVRRRMGVAFQGGALFNSMTLLDNVSLPLVENTDFSSEEITSIAKMKLDMVGLLDATEKLPSELSGGMKKRAAIARAMAMDPEILFLDEPVSGLDPLTAVEIDELISTINRVFGMTIFVVSHDIASAFAIGHRTSLMKEGKLLTILPPEEMRVTRDPRISDFVQRKLSKEKRSSDFSSYLETEGEMK